MATLTAQILVGSRHPNHGGINPTHYLFLSENSRPAWILVEQNVFPGGETRNPRITWIPTIENMLEDALLMIAIHVVRNRGLAGLANSFSPGIKSERVELNSQLERAQRNQLYKKCREIKEFPGIVVSAFEGSSIISQLPVLNKYRMDVEVCRVIYSRLYSPWKEETDVSGALD